MEKKIAELEAKEGEFDDSDQKAYEAIQAKLELLDDDQEQIVKAAQVHYGEATKSVGTAFLLLDPDGRVRREYRIPRKRKEESTSGNGHTGGNGFETPKPPTPDDLRDSQLTATFVHQALAVREALLKGDAARKCVLALILHEKIAGDALSVQHQTNGVTLNAERTEGFNSAALDTLRKQQSKLDPLHERFHIQDDEAYAVLRDLSGKKVDALIDLLTVQCLDAHLLRPTKLISRLARELGVNVRRYWRPDEKWLAAYQKIQLAALIGELRGPVYGGAAETKKKSELVTELAKLFADAAEGAMEDKALAEKLNAWLPANLQEQPPQEQPEPVDEAQEEAEESSTTSIA